jgi:hypothetical protein
VPKNNYFDKFPRELFAIILANLPRSSICNSFRVCKSWSKQSSNEYLWKLLYERDIKYVKSLVLQTYLFAENLDGIATVGRNCISDGCLQMD